MLNLALILLILFASLALLVTLAERYGKPLTNEESQRYSTILRWLVGILLVTSAVKYFLGSG